MENDGKQTNKKNMNGNGIGGRNAMIDETGDTHTCMICSQSLVFNKLFKFYNRPYKLFGAFLLFYAFNIATEIIQMNIFTTNRIAWAYMKLVRMF